jgi:Cortexillin I, coiled coil.
MASGRIDFTIKVWDEASKTFKEVQGKAKATGGEVKFVNNTLGQMREKLQRLQKGRDEAFRVDHIKRYNVLIKETKERIRNLEHQTKTCGEKTEGLWSSYKGYLGFAAFATVGRSMVSVAKSSVEASAQVEKYNATLKVMLGSTTKARDRMQEYIEIAKKTPFELNQVVEAGNQLQAIGRYSRENLEMLGDLASASGKPMEQVMDAFAKLATGQKGEAVNMFRDLLISTEDWTKATGTAIEKNGELKATTEQMIQALPKIMQGKGFMGMMAEQAETTEGKISNLKDAAFSLKQAFGERLTPSVKTVSSVLAGLAGTLEGVVAVPVENKIAQEKIQLNLLVDRLVATNGKEEERKEIIAEIKREYPDFLKNIDFEKASTLDLANALRQTNKEYDRKIKKAIYSSKIEALVEKNKSVVGDIADYEMSLAAKRQIAAINAKLKGIVGTSDVVMKDGEPYYKKRGTNLASENSWIDTRIQNPKARTQVQSLYVQREAARDMLTAWDNEEGHIKKLNAKAQGLKSQINMWKELSEAEDEPSVEKKDTKKAQQTRQPQQVPDAPQRQSSGGAGAHSGYAGSGQRATQGSGGAERNITTTIHNLIGGNIVIQTTTLKESAAEIKQIVLSALSEAVSYEGR